MNILINLLPETRQAKLAEQRRRRTITGVATIIWVSCGVVIAALVLYNTSQKIINGDLTKRINAKEKQLEGVEGLADALTAQQHLASLPQLYANRTYFTKFFDAYATANPGELKLNNLAVDSANTLTATGMGSSYAAIAKLAKALEAENVTLGANASPSKQPYFSNVTIQSVARSGNQINFTLTATVQPGVTSGN